MRRILQDNLLGRNIQTVRTAKHMTQKVVIDKFMLVSYEDFLKFEYRIST